MKRTITRLFDTRAQAESAVRELESAGLHHDDISIVASNAGAAAEERTFLSRDNDKDGDNETAEGAGEGAVTGGLIGGAGGLLAGLGMLAIPGLGPVVAAGWLASTAVGALAGAAVGGAAGGLLGALKDAGVTEDDAHVYAEGVRRGGSLVAVRADESEVATVEGIFNGQRGVTAAERGALYRQDGWTRFDESAGDRL